MMETAGDGRMETAHTRGDITGKLVLKNFVIPKKRKPAGTGSSFMAPCPTESREYGCILSILSHSRLDQRKDVFLSWECQDVQLVNNEELLKQFLEKRSEMRSKGRQAREMEERFCFLVASAKDTKHICQEGLKRDTAGKCTLGNPLYGVYLYRNVDVALRNTINRNLIIFKVILGKVKKVPACLGKNSFLDPTIHYDCYVSKELTGRKDTLLQQAMTSSVFIFDYNENQELQARPRQCLPYAVVSVAPVRNTFSTASRSNMASAVKNPSVTMLLGSAQPLKTCTIAERWGKGENASVTFRHLRAPEKCMRGFVSSSLETASSSQREGKTDVYDTTSYSALHNGVDYQQHVHGCNIQRHWASLPEPAKAQISSALLIDGSCPFYKQTSQLPLSNITTIQDYPHILGSNNQDCRGIYGQYPSCHSSTAVALSSVPTATFYSQTTRDPRLYRRQRSVINKTSPGHTQQDTSSDITNSEHDVMKMDANKPQKQLGNQTKFILGASSTHNELSENLSPGFSKKNGIEQTSSIEWPKNQLLENVTYHEMKDKERILSVENVPLERKKLWLDKSVAYDIDVRAHKDWFVQNDNPMCYAKTFTELSTSRVETGPNSLTQPVPLEKSIDYRHPEMEDQMTLQVPSFSTNVLDQFYHSNEETTLESHVSRSTSQWTASENVKHTSMDDNKNCISLLEITEVDKHTKTNEEEMKANASEENTDDNEQGLLSEGLNHTENIHYQTDQICYTGEWKSNLEHLKENSELQNVDEQCLDLGETQLEPGKGSLLTNQTAILNPTHKSENTKEEDTENSTRLIHLGVSREPENNKCENNSNQNSDAIPIDESVMTGDLQRTPWSSNAVEKNEEEFLFPLELMDNGGVKETQTQAANIRNSSIHSNDEHVLKDYLCNQDLKGEQGKTQNLQSNLINNKLSWSTEKAEGNDEEPQISDTLLCMLYKRMQFSHMFLTFSPTEEISLSGKPYLKPVILKNNVDNLPSSLENICPSNNNFRITIKNEKDTTYSETQLISKNFPLTRYQKKDKDAFSVFNGTSESGFIASTAVSNRQQSFSNVRFTENPEQVLNTTFTYAPEAHSVNGHNVELVKKMAERYCRRLSVRQRNQKMKNGRTSNKPFIHSLYSHTSDSPGSPLKVRGCTAQPRNKIAKISQPTPVENDRMVQQILPVSTFCSMKQPEESNFENLNSQSNSGVKHQSVSFPQSTVQDISSSEYMRSELCALRTEPLNKTICSRKESDKSRKHQRVKSKRKHIMYNKKNVHCMSGQKCNKLNSEKTCTVGINSQRGHSNVHSILLKRNNKAKKINSKEIPPKQKEDSNKVVIAPLPTAANNEGISMGSEINHPLQMVPEQLETWTAFKGYPTDTDLEPGNSVGLTCKVKRTQIIHRCSTSAESFVAEAQNQVCVDANKNEDHLSNEMYQYGSISGGSSTPAFTPGDKNVNEKREDGPLHKFYVELSKESQTEIFSSQAVEKTRDDATIYLEDTLIPSEAQVEMVLDLQSAGGVSTITVMKEDHYCPLQKQQEESITSSKVRLVTKLKDFLKGAKTEKNKTDKSKVLNKSIKKSRPAGKKWQKMIQSATQIADLNVSATTECSGWHPQGGTCTSSARDENYEQNIASPNQNATVKGSIEKSRGNMSGQQEREVMSNTTSSERRHRVSEISDTLKEADEAASFDQLMSLRSKCEEMLQYFISSFEREQNIDFKEAIVSRDLIIDRYLDHPPKAVSLKCEALNSFFELQMMMEAKQFVENKIRFLSGEPTFRSLLWYDVTLCGEVCQRKIHKQQMSICPFLQGKNSCEWCSELYHHSHVSTLNNQLMRSTKTSYYIYLMKKRESLENLVAQENGLYFENFFQSMPLTCNMNFGDSPESLQVLQGYLKSFRQAHFNASQETIDSELELHLSILCRFLHWKMNYLASCKMTDDHMSWFGLEHLLYDASKILVWKNPALVLNHRSLTKFCDASQQRTGDHQAGTLMVKAQKQSLQNGTTLIKRHSRKRSYKQIEQCEKVPEAKDCRRIKRAPWIPLSLLNAGCETLNHAAKCEISQGSYFHSASPAVGNNAQLQASFELEEKNVHRVPAQPWKQPPKLLPKLMPTYPIVTPWGERSSGPHVKEWAPLAHVSSAKLETSTLPTHPGMWIRMHNTHDAMTASSEYAASFLAEGTEKRSDSQDQWCHAWKEPLLHNQSATDLWTSWGNVSSHSASLTYLGHLRSGDLTPSHSIQLPQQFISLAGPALQAYYPAVTFLNTPSQSTTWNNLQ